MEDDAEIKSLFREKLVKSASVPLAPARDYVAPVSVYEKKVLDWQVRRRWLATAHCLGASFGQLAQLEKVSRASIVALINKELPTAVRSYQRLKVDATWTEIIWYWEQFGRRKEQLMLMSPAQAAQWLKDSHPYTED